MKKRLLALLLCAVTAVGMTACGNKDNTEAVENTESTENAESVPAVNLSQYDYNGTDQVELCDMK